MQRSSAGRVYALDHDSATIERAREEAKHQVVSVLEWITADARQPVDLISQPIDLGLIANAFHGVPASISPRQPTAQVSVNAPEGARRRKRSASSHVPSGKDRHWRHDLRRVWQ
jgi:hypothetical protein